MERGGPSGPPGSMAAGPAPPAVPRWSPAGPLAAPALVGPVVVLRRVGPWGPPKLGLEVGDGVRQDRGMAPAQQRKPKRPVEGWQVPFPEALGLPFPQPHSRHADTVRQLIRDRCRITADPDH